MAKAQQPETTLTAVAFLPSHTNAPQVLPRLTRYHMSAGYVDLSAASFTIHQC